MGNEDNNMHRLLEESKRIKAQADRILKESGIIEILKTYGEVKIGGSYALNVMLRPDLDLFVIAEKHDWNKVLDIQSKIMKTKYFREFDFVNWVDFKTNEEDFLPGYYFQPWVPIDDQLWKIDVWLFTQECDKSAENTEYFKKLLKKSDESKRIAILEIKEAMRQGLKYIKGVNGKLICKAVLESGITTPKEFREFLQIQK
ncbi:MAG: nucleotidyltransferase domain-containing protein [Parcubacteria group bacterium]|nr:nucleotidyltransferase domain-containing protein [Parcubacteria group bacterium]